MQTPDPNNPVRRKEEREIVTIDGPIDAVFLQPGDYVELDVGTGRPASINSCASPNPKCSPVAASTLNPKTKPAAAHICRGCSPVCCCRALRRIVLAASSGA